MSTAIVRTYTSDGFVLAADGRSGDSRTGIISDAEQKIFSFGGMPLAYSFTGSAVKLGPPGESTDVVFDFPAEVSRAVQSISSRRHHTLLDYARRIAGPVHRNLWEARQTGRVEYPNLPSRESGESGSRSRMF
jgi:hypothetical protein